MNGTLTGPVFTNGAWNFNTGTYIFTDSVGQQGTQAGANYSDGSCNGASTLPCQQPIRARRVNPTFLIIYVPAESGKHVTPPPNSFSQIKWAAVDGKGTGETDASPNSTDMNNANIEDSH